MTNPICDLERLKKSFERPLVEDADLKEETAASQWLDDAWGLVEDEIPGAARRIALSEGDPSHLRPETVARAMVAAVIRVLRNPDARRQLGEDTFQETIDSVVSSGQLYFTEAERGRMLAGAEASTGTALPGVYNIGIGG